jgi:hypothetical protein
MERCSIRKSLFWNTMLGTVVSFSRAWSRGYPNRDSLSRLQEALGP